MAIRRGLCQSQFGRSAAAVHCRLSSESCRAQFLHHRFCPRQKYKNAADAIQHSNDIALGETDLYISSTYLVQNDGNLEKCELDDKGNPKDKDAYKNELLELSFTISNEKVKNISFSDMPATK